MIDYNLLNSIFNLGRPIDKDDSFPYIHIAYKYKLPNYRLITSAELFIKGKDLPIPQYVLNFINENNEVIMIANIISNKVTSILFRAIKTKEFIKFGNTKSIFYGIGEMSKDFRYGQPILLVEGHLDRDMMATIYPNTLAIMTNRVSRSQVELLTGLTNKFILMLDNDKAGEEGTEQIKKALYGYRINILEHYYKLKDAGDLVKLDLTNHKLFLELIERYEQEIYLYL